MDELTLLRRTRDDELAPSREALNAGRAALMARMEGTTDAAPQRPARGPRWKWALAIPAVPATLAIGVLVAGTVTMNAQSAHAVEVLRAAAGETIAYADLVPGSGQYLLSHTRAEWPRCDQNGCVVEDDQIIDVYMPADPGADWVLYRDWGTTGAKPKFLEGQSIEIVHAPDGTFYDPSHSWLDVDVADIPIDGAAAYAWIDGQYTGGSASRDEDNFVRITDILRSGLIPAAPRAALLDALSRIPGVTATDDVANLDGATGVAIGRNEILRGNQRMEMIIDPQTGLVIGERQISGTQLFGFGPSEVTSLTAISTTIVDAAP